MSEEINIAGQLKFASQHLFNLIIFIGILYYFLKDIVVKFFSNRSLKLSKEIEEANKSNIGDLIKAEMEDSKTEDE